VADLPVMIDLRKPKIFERQMPKPLERRIDRSLSFADLCENALKLLYIHALRG
jgi:hypothetical protein